MSVVMEFDWDCEKEWSWLVAWYNLFGSNLRRCDWLVGKDLENDEENENLTQ